MRIIFSKGAFDSLEAILDYYSDKISEFKLHELRDKLLGRIKMLEDFPHAGQQEESLKTLNKGYRRLIEGKYKIIYRIEKSTIYITDIFDSRQHPHKIKK